MNENEFIDWQDANWNELVKEFVETQIDLFHEYCVTFKMGISINLST